MKTYKQKEKVLPGLNSYSWKHTNKKKNYCLVLTVLIHESILTKRKSTAWFKQFLFMKAHQQKEKVLPALNIFFFFLMKAYQQKEKVLPALNIFFFFNEGIPTKRKSTACLKHLFLIFNEGVPTKRKSTACLKKFFFFFNEGIPTKRRSTACLNSFYSWKHTNKKKKYCLL